MGELGFAATEFAVDFADTRALEATASPLDIFACVRFVVT
jgi:hypothetical protein